MIEISRDDFKVAVGRIAESVYDFHERFGIEGIPHDRTFYDVLRKRLSILTEEVGEHARALNKGDIVNAVDEAVDILYVAIGTILCLEDSGSMACLRIADMNDQKVPSTHGESIETGKVLNRG